MIAHASTDESGGWLTLANRHTGERLQLRRVWQEGELCLELRGTLPPHRDGPPLHIHYGETEEGTVSAGTLGAEVDGRRMRIEKGETARWPMGSVHRWWNAGDDTLAFEGTAKPLVDLDLYLRAAFDVMNSGSGTRPPLFYIAHLAWRHRKTQRVLIGPRWIQAVLFPAIVLVGTVLGRYRGTDWPGCPKRCPAAPLLA